ncbi:MAG: hypothetical protein JWN99_357 [Ilumatobacteraceae bacterium]|nr:hypothetical protein [Ilumatobacteraceae bacterium]
MPRRNRVDPFGDLHAVDDRGMFTGNRGCLVDDDRRVTRHHASNLWITCVTSFRGWSHPLDEPHRWTPLFFLDDAVALAAGHRPCGLCRCDEYRSYRDAVTRSLGSDRPVLAGELNGRLATERLRRGAGIDRADDRRLWSAPIDELPDGTVIVGQQGEARLVLRDQTFAFGFGGWTAPRGRATSGDVHVLTPPTSVAALRHGFRAVLHRSISS